MHKEMAHLKKQKEKFDSESSKIGAKLRLLHDGEHPCLSMLLDFVASLEKTGSGNNDSTDGSKGPGGRTEL